MLTGMCPWCEGRSNTNWTFYKNVLISIFFSKLIPVFLHIFPAPLYAVTIDQVASLCSFQKWFLVAHPSIIAHV